MSWISIILMILTNGPSIIRLIIEIRGLLRDLKGEEKKAVMEMCREDLLAFKKDKDKAKLMSAIKSKKLKRMSEMNGSDH
jgi:hypothetical protein